MSLDGERMNSEYLEGYEITVAAVGDLLINRRVSVFEKDERFMALMKILRDADVGYANFETVIHDYEFPPGSKNGSWYGGVGSWVVDELKWMGIDMVGCANNHSFDYSTEGLLNTKKALIEGDIINAGTGRDLGEARAPVYMDTGKGRVALLDGCSTILMSEMAGYARPDIKGRPGMNGIRYDTRYILDQESAKKLRDITSKWNIIIDEDEEEFTLFGLFGQTFRVGKESKVEREVREPDLSANLRAVKEARRQADWVIFGMHCHERPILRKGKEPEYESRQKPAEFHIEFAHALVDVGVDMFFGAGSHCIRGIEIYKGKPIFYSLGDFIHNICTQQRQPTDAYESVKYGRSWIRGYPVPDVDVMWATPADYYDYTYDPNLPTSTLVKQKMWLTTHLSWTTILPSITMTNGKVSDLKLYPVTLQKDKPRSQRGRPILALGKEAEEIIQRTKKLSAPFGTEIEYKDGIGILKS